MDTIDDCDEIKDLLKKKSRLLKDSHRLSELGDILFRIGYLYYHKGYFNEALDEFEHALEVRKKLNVSLDVALAHRFLGETLCKLGKDFERAKSELDKYYSITLSIKDLVETQRALTTLGNYYMALAESNYREKRGEHLNEAYSYYLKSYETLNEISERRLVDQKEFDLMKARTCLNCAFVMDERRDLIICNEYLKTAIDICEANHFYEDLIRCLYIRCDQAKRKSRMEDTLKTADRIIQATLKTKDYVQQAQDFLFVADIYIKLQNFEKAKVLLCKAYRLKKKCMITGEIVQKLKNVKNVLRAEKELNMYAANIDEATAGANAERDASLAKVYERLGDSLCYLGLFELGLGNYLKQLSLAKRMGKTNAEMAVIYASIGQTYQDLDAYDKAVKYFQLELETNSLNMKSEFKSYVNLALLKEKLRVEFRELRQLYTKAFELAKTMSDTRLQLKAMKLLNGAEALYGVSQDESSKTIHSLSEVLKIKTQSADVESSDDDDDDESTLDREDDEDNESLSLSSDSEADQLDLNEEDETRLAADKLSSKSKTNQSSKKFTVKRNLRGETQLHVACIKGNFKMAKKLIDEGHPINERDNLNWLPIHEACNYGHVELVELLVKHGAKINDSIGPITPIHDAAQNGHLEVVKLLIRAGAFIYVFTHEGYTPLDFLVKYKEDNKIKMSPSALQLYKELHDYMLNAIRGKDKSYKIKKVEFAEDNYIADADETDTDEAKSSSLARSKKRSEKDGNAVLFDANNDDNDEKENEHASRTRHACERMCLSSSSSDDEAATKEPRNVGHKKPAAVSQYKKAINSIGSKSSSGATVPGGGIFHKRLVDKVIVTENEYERCDDWLINDYETSATKAKRPTSSSASSSSSTLLRQQQQQQQQQSTKRKHISSQSEAENSDDDERTTGVATAGAASSRRTAATSQKKRASQQSVTTADLLIQDSIDSLSLTTADDDYQKLSDDDDPMFRRGEPIDTIVISSPFKSHEQHTSSHSGKSKRQVQTKLTKMKTAFSSSSSTSTSSSARSTTTTSHEVTVVQAASDAATKPKAAEPSAPSNWKIKAIIDNRNFLIPISNVNSSIDELTAQIVTRYKVIFCNEPTYREPKKVILKSADDLILFGQDSISDVLSNMSQVHLVVESWKDAPTVSELYDEACQTKSLPTYSNIKAALKDSESSQCLNLGNLVASSLPGQFELIADCLRQNAKLSLSSQNNPYARQLTTINLARNMLSDEDLAPLLDMSVLADCVHLKMLDLSLNLLTAKSVRALDNLANAIKQSGNKATLFSVLMNAKPLEKLKLNGNDIGCSATQSSGDALAALTSLLASFQQTLSELNLADCKITIADSAHSSASNETAAVRDEAVWKRFFAAVKSSNLTRIDVSYNKFGARFLANMLESLPSERMESVNVGNALILTPAGGKSSSDSIRLAERKEQLFDSLVKFVPFGLTHLSLRNLNFTQHQTNDLISLTACGQLKSVDLSYNSIDLNLVKLLFQECPLLEDASLVNSSGEDSLQIGSGQVNWCEILAIKFDDQQSASGIVPLKRLELRIDSLNDKYQIKNIFRKRWHNNSIKIFQSSAHVLEIIAQ